MRIAIPLLLLFAPAIGACVPMMAVSAVDMAARAGQGHPVSNEELQPNAREACSAEAARYGEIHIIDVEQAAVNKIIVWGTVDDGKSKRSFECDFTTKITGFKLRPITPPR